MSDRFFIGRSLIGRLRIGRIAGAALVGLLLAAIGFIVRPLPAGLTDYRPVASLRILDRRGNLLRELLSRDDGRSVPLASPALSTVLRQAFIAAEDHTFLSHPGLSLRAIARAVWTDVRARKKVAGASTITQQLARTLVPRPRTLWGKAREALWALRLEAHLSKDEILTQYLNRVSFGSNTFGVEAAARLYFNRSARDLSLAQAAALAALPRGPTAYHPLRHGERLRERQSWVLTRMATLGFITPEASLRAKGESLDLSAFTAAFRAPHFVNFVVAHLDRWGLRDATEIRTSLDPHLQDLLEQGVQRDVARLAAKQAHQGAGLVIDNANGEVLAYVGSADFFDDEHAGQYDGVQQPRQPGSTLKPFLYGEGFVSGLTPASVLADTPADFEASRGDYRPQNYDRRSSGPVRVREALASSLNVPAVRVAERLGPQRFLEALHRAGFDSLHEPASYYGLGLALGNGEVTPWELGRAYSGLARGGQLISLRPVLEAHSAQGIRLAIRAEHAAHRFLDPTSSALLTDILSDSAARAPAFGLDNPLRLPFPVAVKTGTSKGYSDNWTAGYTHERTVAIWVGNFDRRPMIQSSGVTGAAPLFRSLMIAAMEGRTPQAMTSVALSSAQVCPLSGERAGRDCPNRVEELFAPGTEPKGTCTMHRAILTTAGSNCQRLARGQRFVTDVGPQYYAWAAEHGEGGWQDARCSAGPETTTPIAILTPRAGDAFYLLDDLPLRDQAIPLRVRASVPDGPLALTLDGHDAGVLSPPFQGHLDATPGAHLLTVHRPGNATPLAQASYRVAQRKGVSSN